MSKQSPKLGKAFQKRVEAQAKRTAQRAQLLVDNPKFQTAVQKLRKEVEIPVKGLKPGKAVQEWENRTLKKDLEYMNGSGQRLQEIIKRYPGAKNAAAQARAMDRDVKNAPLARVRYGVISIVRKFDLAPAWQPGLKAYLLTNRPELLRPEPRRNTARSSPATRSSQPACSARPKSGYPTESTSERTPSTYSRKAPRMRNERSLTASPASFG